MLPAKHGKRSHNGNRRTLEPAHCHAWQTWQTYSSDGVAQNPRQVRRQKQAAPHRQQQQSGRTWSPAAASQGRTRGLCVGVTLLKTDPSWTAGRSARAMHGLQPERSSATRHERPAHTWGSNAEADVTHLYVASCPGAGANAACSSRSRCSLARRRGCDGGSRQLGTAQRPIARGGTPPRPLDRRTRSPSPGDRGPRSTTGSSKRRNTAGMRA